MKKLHLTIATQDYDHFRDFRTGEVRAEGIEHTWLMPELHEIFARFTANREWDVSELSFAKFAAQVNESSENIGARRLHTIMEKLLEEVSFAGPDLKKKTVKIDAVYVRKQLTDIVKDQDLARYIL